ncbi:MAG: hypothetical protein NTU75_09495, partial [Sphingomonadales bacterium]|nr:hypothetical protein [Sphingomonadales bacterium]
MLSYLCHAEHISTAEFKVYVVDLVSRNKISRATLRLARCLSSHAPFSPKLVRRETMQKHYAV